MSSGNQALQYSLQTAVEIAQNCTDPEISWIQFIELAKLYWDAQYENNHQKNK